MTNTPNPTADIHTAATNNYIAAMLSEISQLVSPELLVVLSDTFNTIQQSAFKDGQIYELKNQCGEVI